MTPSSTQNKRGAKSAATTAGRYTVAPGTQVHHDDRLYEAGEAIDAPEAVAEQWLARGYVTEKEG